MNLGKSPPHWRRRLDLGDRPAYLLIADLIAEDMRDGRLGSRDRLPTLRELADQLRLNYTTCARAYAEARKRGLIDSRPGMGTYVRGSAPALPLRGGSGAEMTMNMPPEPADPVLVQRLQSSAAELFASTDPYALMRYQDFGGTGEDRDAAVHWLRHRLPGCDAARVLVCPGIHSALAALISQLARPGELICVESLTYPGVKAIATQLGVQLHALKLDDEGPSAAEFELACKTLKPKALYCNPTLLNPTTTTTSRLRREALADIALRYSIPIIEDDAYSMLPRQTPPPLAVLAPGLTYYITGLSKCVGAGLRTAYVCAPTERVAQRLAGALRATTVMASPFTNALATLWVGDGTATLMCNAVRDESIARQALAATHLARHAVVAQPEGFHLWLPLTSGWSVVEFASFLRTRGVGVVASAAFSTDGDPPDAVRICLGGPLGRAECDDALRLIAETLEHPLHPPRDGDVVGAGLERRWRWQSLDPRPFSVQPFRQNAAMAITAPAPTRLALYLDLIRWNRPAGSYLLLWPSLSALWIAAGGFPGWHLLIVFVLGTFLMRSAGCAVNDVADRDFDRHVKRTANRPVTSGAIGVRSALVFGAVLAAVAFALVLTTTSAAVGWSIAALAISIAYPFTKRFFSMPQAVLGVAFSFGIPMAFAAAQGQVPALAWGLLVGNLFWVLAYDTEYAMVDRDDDLKIGIRTSAITLGRFDVAAVMAFYAAFIAIWAVLGRRVGLGWPFYAGLIVAALIAAWHGTLIRDRSREGCFRAFRLNHWLGLAVFVGVVLGSAVG